MDTGKQHGLVANSYTLEEKLAVPGREVLSLSIEETNKLRAKEISILNIFFIVLHALNFTVMELFQALEILSLKGICN